VTMFRMDRSLCSVRQAGQALPVVLPAEDGQTLDR